MSKRRGDALNKLRNGKLIGLSTLAMVVTTLCMARGAYAQKPANLSPSTKVYSLDLASGRIDTMLRQSAGDVDLSLAKRGVRYVIQLDAPITKSTRQALQQAGVDMGAYLPNNAYVVKLDRADQASLASIGEVRWMAPFQPAWKIDAQLGKRVLSTPHRLALDKAGLMQVVITLFDGEPLANALPAIQGVGISVLSTSTVGTQWVVDATIDPSIVEQLSTIASVQYIEEAPEGVLRNDSNEWIVQSNINNVTPVWDAGLNGTGQVVGLIDGTIQLAHCAFEDSVAVGPSHRKIIALRNPGSTDVHGTHVAGTLAGDSPPIGVANQYDGVAFGSKISFANVDHVFGNPGTLYARLSEAHADGARVHSNSWGDDSTTAYTTWSRQIDQFSYDFEESLVVFASTNLSILKTPENAKNVLAVGGTFDTPAQEQHCTGGIGPTADGRRKPEIFAPGCGTLSANANSSCGITSLSGTSMACPVISGAGVLARQYFVEGYYPTGLPENNPLIPTGALIKATLINSAVDMTGEQGYPSAQEGWGRLLLDNALFFPGDTAALDVVDVRNVDGLSTGEQFIHVATTVASNDPLKITLVWTEPPASIGAANPVINNLDLEVIAPDGLSYHGNVMVNGESLAGGSFDTLNNVERIIFNTPDIGVYTILIHGTVINQGTQGFALAINGNITDDCNGNGINDQIDVVNGSSLDCNANMIPDECEPDCNGNTIPDDCDLLACLPSDTICQDCNNNGQLDACDILSGNNDDCNTNGIPDTCDLLTGVLFDNNGDNFPDACCLPTSAPDANTGLVAMNRYISFHSGNIGLDVAFQVTIDQSTNIPGAAGQVKWVGPPNPVTGVSRLQCDPEIRNWSSIGDVIIVSDKAVAPGTTYMVRAMGIGCSPASQSSFSSPTTVTTANVWGDCVSTFDGATWAGPDDIVNANDIQAVVSGFRLDSFAPELFRTDLNGQVPDGFINASDILSVVNAFQLVGYPFSEPQSCPQVRIIPDTRSVIIGAN